MSTLYDVIVVGSGAGGSAAAHHLARAGLSVALVEKGPALPRNSNTLDVQQVVHEGKFKSGELWQNGHGQPFAPEEYFNLGGKTKWYGAALLRYDAGEMVADIDRQYSAWPIEPAQMADFYDRAEQLLGAREFHCEPGLAKISDKLRRRSSGWRCDPLPLGLSEGILGDSVEAGHFDGFASPRGLKSDAETVFLEPIRHLPNFQLYTGVSVTELLGRPGDPQTIEGVRLGDGRVLHSRKVLLAAGALHSPRLLQRYLESSGLAQRLPCYDVVGRFLKMHLLTAVVAVSPRHIEDAIRKTRIFTHADLPHSSVQPLGFDGELISTLIPKIVPRWMARQIGARSYGFFLQTEDGAHPDNRVRAASNSSGGLPVLDYDATRTPTALAEHERLVRRFRADLLRAGLVAFSQRIGLAGTAHVSGTLTAGTDPTKSVVDANGLVHGMRSLYVVDGSVLARSSRVNPSLTIYAWSMRVAQRLGEELNQLSVRSA